MTVPIVCNSQIVDNTTEDEMKIELAVQLKDLPEMLAGATSQSFGVGVTYSKLQIWVSSFDFGTIPPVYRTFYTC